MSPFRFTNPDLDLTPLWWILGGVLGAFTAFVLLTLLVALFAKEERIRDRAWEILKALLTLFRALIGAVRRGGRW